MNTTTRCDSIKNGKLNQTQSNLHLFPLHFKNTWKKKLLLIFFSVFLSSKKKTIDEENMKKEMKEKKKG